MWKSDSAKRSATISPKLGACLLVLYLTLSLDLSAACQEDGPTILPARPDAIGGGNPFEGLGRSDDPNPSRAGDFPELNTSASASASADAAPQDPNSSPNQKTDGPSPAADSPESKADGPADGTGDGIGDTPGAAEALLKAQQLAKDEGTASTASAGDPDAESKKPGLLDPDPTNKAAASRNEASFFTVVADSPIRTTLVDIREGRYEAALSQLKTLYERNPAAIELQYLMAVSSVMLHRNSEAIAHYRRVLEDRQAPLRLKKLAQKGLDKIQPK
ncbi:MAG: tetratricopeptide repeat protein [Candidatus Obscuribacterales bacterium]